MWHSVKPSVVTYTVHNTHTHTHTVGHDAVLSNGSGWGPCAFLRFLRFIAISAILFCCFIATSQSCIVAISKSHDLVHLLHNCLASSFWHFVISSRFRNFAISFQRFIVVLRSCNLIVLPLLLCRLSQTTAISSGCFVFSTSFLPACSTITCGDWQISVITFLNISDFPTPSTYYSNSWIC